MTRYVQEYGIGNAAVSVMERYAEKKVLCGKQQKNCDIGEPIVLKNIMIQLLSKGNCNCNKQNFFSNPCEIRKSN